MLCLVPVKMCVVKVVNWNFDSGLGGRTVLGAAQHRIQDLDNSFRAIIKMHRRGCGT